MPPLAIALLLISALMHAAWNGWMKGASGRLAYLWWGQLFAIGLYALPIVLTTPMQVPPHVWPILLASAVCETGYMVAITRAYGLADMSLVYPLARGSAPAFVALMSALLLGERLPAAGYVGIGLLIVGLYLVSLPSWRDVWRPVQALRDSGARWALAAGLFIASYSLFDKMGVSAMPPPAYTLWTFVAMTVVSAPAVVWLEGRAVARAAPRVGGWRLVVGGIFVLGAYFLVLWALSLAPASYVSAVRSSSILVGAAWGAWMFHEKVGWARGIGACLMVAGIALLAWRG